MNQKEWTIMVYMAGDNNLAVDMAYAMEQIRSVAGEMPECPNLFVYYDGNSPSIPTLYCDFSDPTKARYVRSFKVPDKLYPVPSRVNENAADKRSILNFVDWCVNKVPVENDGEVSYGRRARRYAFIFSGHSLGFQDIGLFRDESYGRSMKMAELYDVMERLVADEGELGKRAEKLAGEEREREKKVLIGQQLDLLGFDSCVMGMLEVGYQFTAAAKTMIASEGSVPSAGWTYAKILGSLAQDTDGQSAESVAEGFVRQFIKSQDAYTVGGVSVDMAAWDLSKLGELTSTFDRLAAELLDAFADPDSRIYRQMERILLHVHWKAQTYMFDQNIDLGDFCELLEDECSSLANETNDKSAADHLRRISAACRSVLTEIKNAVILSGFSGSAYQYSNGVSVFFPWSREGYEVSRKNYEALSFSRHTPDRKLIWPGFLKKYLDDVARRKFQEPVEEVPAGAKYRYYSGVAFDDSYMYAGNGAAVKMGGQEGSKMGGQEGSKMGGQEGSKMGGQEGSKMGGQEGSKMGGQEGSKMGGQEGSKMGGQKGSKMGGQEGSKMGGQEGSKMGGQEGSKMGGQEGSKMGGQEGSKLGVGGGSTHFFDSLRLFKNIEGRWNISGFTKKPGEEASDAKGAGN